jgi:hypothetical protein
LIESDEVNQPLDGGAAPPRDGVHRETSAAVLAGDTPAAGSVAPIVIASDPAGEPHAEQNRASSGIAAPQLKQRTGGL